MDQWQQNARSITNGDLLATYDPTDGRIILTVKTSTGDGPSLSLSKDNALSLMEFLGQLLEMEDTGVQVIHHNSFWTSIRFPKELEKD